MEIVTARSFSSGDQRRRRKVSDGHVVTQLLDSPLPTPRRSCCGSAADTPRSLRGASPQRTHVPFSWESSPGVPKVGGTCGAGMLPGRDALPPKPPPGRCVGGGTPWHVGNTTDATSSDDDDDDTFSDALDRISSSDRLAAFSARLSSIEGTGSRRLSSFIMDRFLPAAKAIATTSAEKHPKKSPFRTARCSKHEEEDAPVAARRGVNSPRGAQAREQPKLWPHHAPALQCEERASPLVPDKDAYQVEPPPHVDEDPQDEPMSPSRSACGFMVFFPCSIKPMLCGFPWSPARHRTQRADVGSTATSTPRRSTTLGDVLVKEIKRRDSELSHWYEHKSGSRSGREWSSSGSGLGMSILGTSKRYCADAKKALSRLARSATDNGGGGGSPRISSRERRSRKTAASPLHSTSGRMPQLKPPSESWLSHASGSNAVNTKRWYS